MTRPFLLIVLLTAPPPGTAMPQSADAARATVDSFFAAVGERRWMDAVSYLDLTGFDRQVTEIVRRDSRPMIPPITAEEMLRADPSLPREVAEYRAKQSRALPDTWRTLLPHSLAGIDSAAQLAGLRQEEVAARWLEASYDPSYHLRRLYHALGCPAPLEADTISLPRRRTLAAVMGDQGDAYVLWEESWSPDETTPAGLEIPQVMPLVRKRGTWRIPTDGLSPVSGLFGIETQVQGCPTAEVPRQGDPLAVVDSFLTAFENKDSKGAVGFLYLYQLETELAGRLRSARVHGRRTLTVEEYLKHDPDMPRSVAEYEVSRIRARSSDSALVRSLLQQYAGVDSLAQLERLTTEEAAARRLAASDRAYQTTRAWQALRGCVPDSISARRSGLSTVAGTQEPAGRAYVLVRQEWTYPRQSPPSVSPDLMVLTLIADGTSWKIIWNHGITSVLQTDLAWRCPPGSLPPA